MANGWHWPVSDLWERAPTGRFLVDLLHLRLLGYLERVVNIDREIAQGAFQLAVAAQQLHSSRLKLEPYA